MTTLEELGRKRGALKRKLTTIETYLNTKGQVETAVDPINKKEEEIDKIYEEYTEIKSRIEQMITDDNEEAIDRKFQEFEEQFWRMKAGLQTVRTRIEREDNIQEESDNELNSTVRNGAGSRRNNDDLITALITALQGMGNNSNHQEPRIGVKLPELKLPRFTGKIEEWRTFMDSFESIIDKEQRYTNIDKYHYLSSCLSDEIRNDLQSRFKLTGEGYTLALQYLKDKYSNKRAITNKHFSEIFKIKSIERESHKELRSLIDCFSANLDQAKALNPSADMYNMIIVFMVSTRLDDTTRKAWEIEIKNKDYPSWDEMRKFLEGRCVVLERMSYDKELTEVKTQNQHSREQSQRNPKPKPTNYFQRPVTSLLASTAEDNCILCKDSHRINNCPEFLKLPTTMRVQKVKEFHLCFNCLRSKHGKIECTSKGRCRECAKVGNHDEKHHTLLHFDKTNGFVATTSLTGDTQETPESQQDSGENNTTRVSCNVSSGYNNCYVFLQTAIVKIQNAQGDFINCRALLDSGSQSSFITKELATTLGLKTNRVSVTVEGLYVEPVESNNTVKTVIKSKVSAYSKQLDFLVLPQIKKRFPYNNINMHQIEIPKNLQLADPMFNKPGKIDILIGSDIFFDMLMEGYIQITPTIALKATVLGWLVTGKLTEEKPQQTYSIQSYFSCCDNLNNAVQRFWELESVDCGNNLMTKEEQQCEDLFQKTTTRNDEGRFVVQLPTRPNVHQLSDNKATATKRFLALERKLSDDNEQKKLYHEFMNDYLVLGHMTPVKEEVTKGKVHYLPHHGVLKMSSTTTKLRVVFNASCKGSNGLSLNDTLRTGPVVQKDLFTIWLNFRMFRYAMTADCKMMYRQIIVHPSQTNLQRIVWRNNEKEPLKSYALQTVTYGTTPASYLATRCLKELAIEFQREYPETATAIANNTYMDDFLYGSQTIEGAIKVQSEVIKILQTAKFELRKWMANHPALLENIREDHRETIAGDNESIKALGLHWNPHTDKLKLNVKTVEVQEPYTKRSILAHVASFFDPLGMEAPVILLAKILLQKLWKLKLGWDQPIPEDMKLFWRNYTIELQMLRAVEIDRFVAIEEFTDIEIHGFCDSSEKAYGACIYIRSTNQKHQLKCQLLCSKSKVAPLNKRTLPELELCGAQLLARLYDKVKPSINTNPSKSVMWTDSTIVMAWLRHDPTTKFKPFVANRVAQAQRMTEKCEWRHIATDENPADHVSRGLMPKDFIDNQLWWNGPSFMITPEEEWQTSTIDSITMNEHINSFLSVNNNGAEKIKFEILHSTMNTRKLIRVIALVLRFIKNAKNKREQREIGVLTIQELQVAHNVIIKLIQEEIFGDHIKPVNDGQPSAKYKGNQLIEIYRNSPLIKLNPFLDSDGVIRVGGRIDRAIGSYDRRHPIILPGNHPFTESLIRDTHLENAHSGQRATLSYIRQKYWPLRVKWIIKKSIRKCIRCTRAKPEPVSQFMGELPAARVQLQYPFFQTGIDYCGPVYLKTGTVRSRKTVKAYIAVFVCMSTKAVHLELVSDMTTSAFLAALDRFYSDHGVSRHMYSDNGSNFIGAAYELNKLTKKMTSNNGLDFADNNNELSELHGMLSSPNFQREIYQRDANKNIEWHFQPPHAPEFGGLWESTVKSVKFHLTRLIGNAMLTFEEMYTTLKKISAILNSRPLFPESEDVNDYGAITPGHFLIGRPMNCVPEEDVIDIKTNRLDRWQRLQKITQQFHRAWSRDYLHQLQQRTKRFKNRVDIHVGDLVLLVEDNISPMKWNMGRIIETHPGQDDIIRVVTVKTQHGIYKRPVCKIAILPIENPTSQIIQRHRDVATPRL